MTTKVDDTIQAALTEIEVEIANYRTSIENYERCLASERAALKEAVKEQTRYRKALGLPTLHPRKSAEKEEETEE